MNAQDLFAPVPVDIPRAEGYVLCEFGGITLAIEQSDVVTIEHGSELMAPLPGESALGWFEGPHGPWPVYALNADLALLSAAPRERTFLAFLKTDDAPFGLLCENVRIAARRSDLPLSELPSVMREQQGPIRAVSRIAARRIALISGKGAIASHIARQCERSATEDWQ